MSIMVFAMMGYNARRRDVMLTAMTQGSEDPRRRHCRHKQRSHIAGSSLHWALLLARTWMALRDELVRPLDLFLLSLSGGALHDGSLDRSAIVMRLNSFLHRVAAPANA
jgi:hypothetical protein